MTEQPFRLAKGGRIDRGKRLGFTFNNKSYEGHPGDTLASALLANGVLLVGRSFKYHRPRGIMTAGPEEPCAIIQLGTGPYSDPNCRATQVELTSGLTAASINCWPSVQLDFGVASNMLHNLVPAGFYYKTFMWPSRGWLAYEHFIRRAAGLGRAPTQPDPDRYDKRFDHVDVLIAGGGPTGIAAALAAGRTGARVLLVDEQSEPGGQLLWRSGEIDGSATADWLTRSLAELAAMPEVRLLTRSTVAGYYDHNLLTVLQRLTDHLPTGSAPATTAAPAAVEDPRAAGRAGDRRDRAAAGLRQQRPPGRHAGERGAGLCVALRRASRQPRRLLHQQRQRLRRGRRPQGSRHHGDGDRRGAHRDDPGIGAGPPARHRDPARPCRDRRIGRPQPARGHRGAARRRRNGAQWRGEHDGVRSALRLGRLEPDGASLLAIRRQAQPSMPSAPASCPGKSVQAERSAGCAVGSFGLAECLWEGHAAGLAAAKAAGFTGAETPAPRAASETATPLLPLWEVPSLKVSQRSRKFIDLQNDVTAGDIALAAREGYVSVEHAKRYTTAGMGVDQGKTANVNALAILAGETAGAIPAVGTTTFRPPYTPVTIGAFAGRDIGAFYDPLRKTPMTAWHEAHGAVFEPVGRWRRPLYYPNARRDMAAAVQRECLAVRNNAVLCDTSTLGKIDIQGRDAVTLLDRVYTNSWRSLGIGKCRYGLMLKDDGMVFDDGVTGRIGENHYLMTTTSGRADAVFGWLDEWLQCEWPNLDVYLTSVTTHWATVNLAGPKSREVLAAAGVDFDTSRQGSPYMSVREGRVAGIPARLFRVSFTGELSFEINVPARYGAGTLGSTDGGGRCARHHTDRHRGVARATRREGLHRRRPRHGRYRNAVRSRHGLDRR